MRLIGSRVGSGQQRGSVCRGTTRSCVCIQKERGYLSRRSTSAYSVSSSIILHFLTSLVREYRKIREASRYELFHIERRVQEGKFFRGARTLPAREKSPFIFRGRIRQILEDGGPKPLNLKEKAMCKVIIQENARARHSDRDCRWRAMLKASGRIPHCNCFCHATAQLVPTVQTPLIRMQHACHRWIVAAAQSNRTTHLSACFFSYAHVCTR